MVFRRFFTRFSVLFLFWVMSVGAAETLQKPVDTQFYIQSDFPKSEAWIRPLMSKALRKFHEFFSYPGAPAPKKIIIRIKKNSNSRGISGNASRRDDSLNFASSVWDNEKYRRWILVHELVNLMSSYVGSQAYPPDWWANGRSPFPVYASAIILRALGYTKDYQWLRSTDLDKPDQQLIWELHQTYGVDLFRDFFQLIQGDGIDFQKIGKRWPAADETRSLYAVAYLSLAARENFGDLFTQYEIAKKPIDWHKRHPRLKFEPYRINRREVSFLLQVRSELSDAVCDTEAIKMMYNQGQYIDAHYACIAARK